jgi:hypothetical protein
VVVGAAGAAAAAVVAANGPVSASPQAVEEVQAKFVSLQSLM